MATSLQLHWQTLVQGILFFLHLFFLIPQQCLPIILKIKPKLSPDKSKLQDFYGSLSHTLPRPQPTLSTHSATQGNVTGKVTREQQFKCQPKLGANLNSPLWPCVMPLYPLVIVSSCWCSSAPKCVNLFLSPGHSTSVPCGSPTPALLPLNLPPPPDLSLSDTSSQLCYPHSFTAATVSTPYISVMRLLHCLPPQLDSIDAGALSARRKAVRYISAQKG